MSVLHVDDDTEDGPFDRRQLKEDPTGDHEPGQPNEEDVAAAEDLDHGQKCWSYSCTCDPKNKQRMPSMLTKDQVSHI
jgi:hypothetical protein